MGLSERELRKAILHLEIIRRTAETELIRADRELKGYVLPKSIIDSLDFHVDCLGKLFHE